MSSNTHAARREFVRTALGMLAAAPFAARSFAQDAAGLEERIEFRRLVAVNRILAHEEVVDAFGHVSVRDPENPRRYVMARSRSPELVEHADLIRFEQDGRSLDPGRRTPYRRPPYVGAIACGFVGGLEWDMATLGLNRRHRQCRENTQCRLTRNLETDCSTL